MFGKDFLITCDYCKKETINTGERDAKSCNELAEIAGWQSFKAMASNKTLHICDKCTKED